MSSVDNLDVLGKKWKRMIDDIHWRSFPLTGEEEVEEKVIIHTLWMLLWPSPAQGWLSPWLCGCHLFILTGSIISWAAAGAETGSCWSVCHCRFRVRPTKSTLRLSGVIVWPIKKGEEGGLRLETDGWQQYPQSTCNGCSSQEAETGELDLGFGWEWKQCQCLTNLLAPDFDNHLERKRKKYPETELWVKLGKLFLQF